MINRKLAFLIILLLPLIFMECQKIREDTLAPQIMLIGRNPDTLLLGCSYIDSVVVKDDYPGATYNVSGQVNGDSAGSYYLDYTAYDSDSNRAYARRKVVVTTWQPAFFVDTFAVSDRSGIPYSTLYYQSRIRPVSENQDSFRIVNFNNFGESFALLIMPDSAGVFNIEYSNEDTLLSGSGHIKCNYTGLSLEYEASTPGLFRLHKANYQKK